MKNKEMKRFYINVVIVVLTLIGTILSFTAKDGEALSVRGFASLKFFTVDSNILEGIASLLLIIVAKTKRDGRPVHLLKFSAASAVGVTFLTVIAFLGPLYGYEKMYLRANFLFHLLIPLLAMAEFVIFNEIKLTIRDCLWCPAVVILYGIGYIINLFVNGFEQGDFYGFVNWGFGTGLGIFAVICLVSFGIGMVLRKISTNRLRERPHST